MAGLRPFTDYIISADSVLHESEDLYALVESHEGRCLKLYVYSSIEDACREVTITPNSKWGGEGSLGCGIGYGYLHRIPVRENLPTTTTNLNYTTNTVTNVSLSSHFPAEATNIGSNNNLQQSEPQQDVIAKEVNANSQADITSPDNPQYSNVPPPACLPAMYSIPNQNVSVESTAQAQSLPYTPYSAPEAPFNLVSYPPTSNLVSYNQTNVNSNLMVPNTPQQTAPISSTLPPPPLSGFQPHSPIIFDPTIAAMSAQKLLSGGAVTTSS